MTKLLLFEIPQYLTLENQVEITGKSSGNFILVTGKSSGNSKEEYFITVS